MNILDKLPFLSPDGDIDANLTDEEREAQAKKDRIKFHRRFVRNGPVKSRAITNGQARRAQKRALATLTRKERKRQVRKYMAQQREAAVLLGQLQAAGVQPYAGATFSATPDQALAAITWIIRHHTPDSLVSDDGSIEVTHEVVGAALKAALNRWQDIVGMPRTALSPAYELPVALSL